jgi:putative cardiolipin synthase
MRINPYLREMAFKCASQSNARFVVLCLVFLLTACATLPPNTGNPVSSAYDEPEATALGQLLSGLSPSHPGQSGFLILDTGRQALQARLALIESAQQALDLQYYIWNSDISGRYVARRLLLAADRGVRVRLLLDDINIGGRDALLAALDSHPNIELRIYNPIAAREGMAKLLVLLGDFNRLNRRMHNKTFVADGAIGIIGGRNIGDEYFDLHTQMNFRDRDMLAVGPVVQDISGNFDAYWNSSWVWPITAVKGKRLAEEEIGPAFAEARASATDASRLRDVPPQEMPAALAAVRASLSQLTWAGAELVYDPPVPADVADSDTGKKTALVLGALTRAVQHDVLIESAYLILGTAELQTVQEKRKRGVQIRALTNSLASNDVTVNHAGYARTRRGMLESGMDLYELRPDAQSCEQLIADAQRCGQDAAFALHSKSVVFDRKTLYVGSFNINLRSAYLNSETALIVHSPELAQQVAASIETNLQPGNSWHVALDAGGQVQWETGVAGEETLHHEPASSWWRRFKVGMIKLLPLEKYY